MKIKQNENNYYIYHIDLKYAIKPHPELIRDLSIDAYYIKSDNYLFIASYYDYLYDKKLFWTKFRKIYTWYIHELEEEENESLLLLLKNEIISSLSNNEYCLREYEIAKGEILTQRIFKYILNKYTLRVRDIKSFEIGKDKNGIMKYNKAFRDYYYWFYQNKNNKVILLNTFQQQRIFGHLSKHYNYDNRICFADKLIIIKQRFSIKCYWQVYTRYLNIKISPNQ